jgi:hypothetical protein
MYSTCLFCHARLGANEAIEQFPVGRRLAFDPARGRLWVVCTRCGRWNLTPLEERWEAIEECERHYRDTRLRASTDHIGLARLREGLDLVRIGEPQRPEFAAWRYGDQFGRRRRRQYLKVGLGLGAIGAVLVGGVTAGVGLGGFGYWVYMLGDRIVKGSPNKTVARLNEPGAPPITVRRKHLRHLSLALGGSGDRWRLGVPHHRQLVHFEGDTAVRIAGQLLPALNRFGGTSEQVSGAVSLLESEPDPVRYFGHVAGFGRGGVPEPGDGGGRGNRISSFPAPVRLALEMAAHEESERRAMEGELAALESAWREAEEVAAIADDMFLPQSITDFIDRHRRR